MVLAVLWQGIRGERTTKRTWKKTDVFMLLYLVSAIFSYGISPCREDVLLGYPGWYMGLVTQGLLVGIYFAVSRYYDGSRSIWWIAGITAGIVTLIGLLNRLDIDVLGTFRGMENGEWNRTQLLSTIGNNNWYAGYISVTAGISLAAAFMGKTAGQSTGDDWELCVFASAITSNSTTAILAACGLSLAVTVAFSAEERPAAAGVGDPGCFYRFRHLWSGCFAVTSDRPGAGRGCRKRLFYPGLVCGVCCGSGGISDFAAAERQERSDRLESGRVFRTFVGLAVAVTLAALLLAVCWWRDICPAVIKCRKLPTAGWHCGRSRFLLTEKRDSCFRYSVWAPDSFYYALYQWGSDAMDWINRGLLDNNIYSNAHNEWLTLLVQQGILGSHCLRWNLPHRIPEPSNLRNQGSPGTCSFLRPHRLFDLLTVHFSTCVVHTLCLCSSGNGRGCFM